jgi:hypothetical protein
MRLSSEREYYDEYYVTRICAYSASTVGVMIVAFHKLYVIAAQTKGFIVHMISSRRQRFLDVSKLSS